MVTFHAALTRKGMSLPMFAGAKVTSDNNVNRIFVSDPGLYSGDDVTLAWFSGTSALPLQSTMPRILDHLMEAAGGERTLFWGPSAGGFAALFYSRFFPGSLAVPINPQTILSNFGYKNQRIYTSAAFGARSHGEHENIFANRICSDLRRHYGGELTNYVLYIQNSTDHHVEQHMEPFLSSLASSDRIRIIMGSEWGEGHVAPPADRIRGILAAMTNPQTDWDLFFRASAGRVTGSVAAAAEAILIEADSLHDWLVNETRKGNLA